MGVEIQFIIQENPQVFHVLDMCLTSWQVINRLTPAGDLVLPVVYDAFSLAKIYLQVNVPNVTEQIING